MEFKKYLGSFKFRDIALGVILLQTTTILIKLSRKRKSLR